MFNVFSPTGLPGFRVRPQDDVPGFDIDENGLPRRERPWSDGMRPGSAAPQYPDLAQAMMPTPGPEDSVQPAPPQPPDWLYKLLTMPLPALPSPFPLQSGGGPAPYGTLFDPVRSYPTTDQNVRAMGDARAYVPRITPPPALSAVEGPDAEQWSSLDAPKPPADTNPREAAVPGAQPAFGGPQPASDRTADPNIVRVADGELAPADDEVQVAQQQGTPGRPPAGQPGGGRGNRQETPPPMQEPGRGYGKRPVEEIERGMTPLQIRINRDQAFRELTRQPLTADQARSALPDDWESTKPADLVDEIKRAAERHGVPIQMFARQLYQEGKFNEPDKLKEPLRMDPGKGPNKGKVPIGYPQMTSDTFQTLKNLAIGRGDTKRSQELATYSLANREQSFDAAAEQLAYLYRLMGGNWPKALAAYNFGPGLMNWFDGKPVSISKDNKPVYISKGKWEEISVYLAYALRGASEDPQSADGYVLRPPNQDRTRDRIYRPAVPSDTIRNP
jgi:hypothetical protein